MTISSDSWAALKAVVELHRPEGYPTMQCSHCHYSYPCPTIEAIKMEMA